VPKADEGFVFTPEAIRFAAAAQDDRRHSPAILPAFRDNILMPRLQQGVQAGFATPPQEQAFEVANLQT